MKQLVKHPKFNKLQAFLQQHIKDDQDIEKLRIFTDELIMQNNEWKRRHNK